jgi:RNA polymerase sigma-70 factor (ECF subfamily)
MWLPEPVDTSSDPALGAERGEALKLAVLLLFEKLSPTERAAYILHEAFDYSYRQIADILQMGEANTRQLVSRARKHIVDGQCTPVSSHEQERLLEVLISATQKGDVAALEGFLAEGVANSSGRCAPHHAFQPRHETEQTPAVSKPGQRSRDRYARGPAAA